MDINLNINLQYNSLVILSYFFLSLLAFILNAITKGKSNRLLFSTYRDSIFNPMMYIRLFTHAIGHENWNHLKNNFLMILLIGPALEEKYGSINLLIMFLITAFITGILHNLFKNNSLLGASGSVFMLIILSSFVNIEAGKIPITLILICLFYVIDEIKDGMFKKDKVSHIGHLIGALCGAIFGFYFLHHTTFIDLFTWLKSLI